MGGGEGNLFLFLIKFRHQIVRVLCFFLLFFQTSIDTNFKSGHFSIIFSDISTEGQINSQLVFFLNTLLDIGDIAMHD